VLSALGLAGGAARVHKKQRRLGRHRDRLHLLPTVVVEQLVDEEVAAFDHLALGVVLAGVPAPHQDLLDVDALLPCDGERLVGLDLVVDQLAAAVVGVDRDQELALRVDDPVATGGAAEPTEHLRVDHAHAGAGEH
jgi:hypothetical protein